MEITKEPITVTPADAAQLLGIGRTPLFALLRDGTLPSFTLGRKRLIQYADLKALPERLASESVRVARVSP
jgi:excisionase family DNA binding protein